MVNVLIKNALNVGRRLLRKLNLKMKETRRDKLLDLLTGREI